jgi:hypothetical protein
MRLLTILLLFIIGFSCSSHNEAEYVWEDLEVSGEFLFEGPNTLQGKPGSPLEAIAGQMDLKQENIQSIHVSACELKFEPDSMRNQVENALVQLVSDKLELVSVATINGIPDAGKINLNAASEQDILPYLQDETTTLVVDANTKSDMEVLNCKVNFKLSILYTN